MMQKFTKAERIIVLDKEDQFKIARGVHKTGNRALHQLTDEEREGILKDVTDSDND